MDTGGSRNVVVAVDGSDHSRNALQWALRCVIRRDSDTVFLVTVEAPVAAYVGGAGSSFAIPEDDLAMLEETSEKHAGSVVEEAEKLCQERQVASMAKVYRGDAREALCEACSELSADVLVVGCRGLSGLKRAFLGSVSDHCVRYARCPVIVVRSK